MELVLSELQDLPFLFPFFSPLDFLVVAITHAWMDSAHVTTQGLASPESFLALRTDEDLWEGLGRKLLQLVLVGLLELVDSIGFGFN